MIKETKIIDYGFETIFNDGIKVRVIDKPSKSTLIEFVQECGKNINYVISSKNKNQEQSFNNLMNIYGKYISDPYGIKPVE